MEAPALAATQKAWIYFQNVGPDPLTDRQTNAKLFSYVIAASFDQSDPEAGVVRTNKGDNHGNNS